jgi:beta-mannosidase
VEWGPEVDVGGTWLAVAADDDRRRTFFEPELDTDDWAPIRVPGSWSARAGTAGQLGDGAVLVRRTVAASEVDRAGTTAAPTDTVTASTRWWLTLEGVAPSADVWFDGDLLGDTDDADTPHTFEVTEQVLRRHPGADHLLALEVAPPVTPTRRRRRDLAGTRGERSAGPWGRVRLHATGPVHIGSLRLRCTRADRDAGVLAWRVTLDTLVARAVRFRVTAHFPRDDGPRSDPPRPPVVHEVRLPLAAGDNVVDGELQVSAPPLWWPRSLGLQPLVRLQVDVELLDEDPELDDADGVRSDEWSGRVGFRTVTWRRGVLRVNGARRFVRGLVIDPPTSPRHAPTAEDAAALLASPVGRSVDLIRCRGHLPDATLLDACDEAGVLVWADLPLVGGMHPSVRDRAAELARRAVDHLGHHPSLALWCCHEGPPPGRNRWVLDRAVRRTLTLADGTRPVLDHPPGPTQVGDAVDMTRALLVWPALGRFVTGPRRRAVAPAEEVARWIGVLRRLRFRPCGGVAVRVDPADGTVAAAFAPVLAVADPLPATVRAGQHLRLRVHLVNEGPRPLLDAEVRARVRWPGGELRRTWAGGAPPDACVPVGVIDFEVPHVHGELGVDLEWHGPGGTDHGSRRDRTVVVPD